MPDFNDILGMGGLHANNIEFKLEWFPEPDHVQEMISNRLNYPFKFVDHCQEARTEDDSDTVLPPGMQTRVHVPGVKHCSLRYLAIKELGKGSFGTVHKAADVDTGNFIAVKELNMRGAGS